MIDVNDTILGLVSVGVPLLIIGFLILRRLPWIFAFFVALLAVGLGYLETTGAVREFGQNVRTVMPEGVLSHTAQEAEPAAGPAMAPASPPAEQPATTTETPPATPAPESTPAQEPAAPAPETTPAPEATPAPETPPPAGTTEPSQSQPSTTP